MRTLLANTLYCIFPEAGDLQIVEVYGGIDEFGYIARGFEEVMARRAGGDIRPVVVYGFDRLERVKQDEGGFILDAPGVFYLKLPARITEVKAVLQKAANFKAPSQGATEAESIRHYTIQRIQAFKHICDNVWMSMEGNTNAARNSLSGLPGDMPSALKEFRQERIKKLAEEYSQLERLAAWLGIRKAQKVPGILAEVMDMIGKIHEGSVSPQNAIELAAQCVKKMQAVAEILSEAKELEHNE
jgi:hypothetical protein